MNTRLMAFLLVFALLIVPLSGCGGTASTVETAASEEVISQQIFEETEVPDPAEAPDTAEETVMEEITPISISYPL